MRKGRELSPVEEMRAKATRTMLIGIVAQNMKGEQSLNDICNTGVAIFAFIKKMKHREFQNIKRLP